MSRKLAALAASLLTLAGCSQGYDEAMGSAPAETPAASVEGTSSGLAAEPAKQEDPAQAADVSSSGPVGKTILAPTDALD